MYYVRHSNYIWGIMMGIMTSFKQKFKENKAAQIAVVLILVVVMFVIYFSTLGGGKKNDEKTKVTAEDYAAELENKLSSVLSQVNGAGRVDVMITLEGGPTYEIAYTVEERKTAGGTSESTTLIKTPVLITKNGTTSPLILSETHPVILGVIVVAQGAADMKVKMDLLRATEAVLKVPLSAIEIFVGKT